MERGKFITLEGIDGSGKTTLSYFLAGYLKKQHIKALALSGTHASAFSKEIVKLIFDYQENDCCEKLSASVLMHLFASAHLQTYQNVIEPALKKGYWVIADRFFDSVLAYHGLAHIPITQIKERDKILKKFSGLRLSAFENCVPDMTFLLDVSIKRAQQRILSRENNNCFDRKSLVYKTRLRQGFLWLSQIEKDRISLINANQELSIVKDKMVQALVQKYPTVKKGVTV